MTKRAPFLILVILVIAPFTAMSQAWLADRSQSEGPGFKLGDSVALHPGIGVDGGYDTNPLRRADNVEGAGRLKLTSYLDLATTSKQRRVQDDGVIDATPPKLSFRLGVAGYYDWYFSDEQSIDDQDDFGLDTHLNFILFPAGKFTLMVQGAYLRTVQPYENADDAHAHHSIRPGVGVRFKPGGGTLSFDLGYRLHLLIFEDQNISGNYNKIENDVRFLTSWKMFPKTALVSRTRFSPTAYLEDATRNHNSFPVRSLFGIQGLITDRFGMLALVGYGASFYDTGENFDSVIAQGELMFFLTPFANIKLGGERDFVDSFYSNFYVKNGGYVAYHQMFGGIFLTTLKGEVYYRDYAQLRGEVLDGWTANEERKDWWLDSTLLLELRVTNWLAFHASASYQANLTDFQYVSTSTDSAGVTRGVDFNKFEVFGGVRCHY